MSDFPMNAADLRTQAISLRLHGLLAHWPELMAEPEAASRVAQWLGWEADERGRRSLERRVRDAHIGRFKPLADFDWSWPAQIDRAAVEDLMTLQFYTAANTSIHEGYSRTEEARSTLPWPRSKPRRLLTEPSRFRVFPDVALPGNPLEIQERPNCE